MTVKAPEDVLTEGLSTRAKTLLAVFADKVIFNDGTHAKKHEFQKMMHGLMNMKDEHQEVKGEIAKALAEEISQDFDRHIERMKQECNAIDLQKMKNEADCGYIVKALAEEGVNWRNRSFNVAAFGLGEGMAKKNPGSEDIRKMNVINSEKAAKVFLEDFEEALPKGLPESAYEVYSTSDGETPALEKDQTLVVTFNEAYEDEILAALKQMTHKRFAALSDETKAHMEKLRGYDMKKTYPEDAMSYGQAEFAHHYMPYIIETKPMPNVTGDFTLNVLRDGDTTRRFQDVQFEEQFPVLDIDRYAKEDKDLERLLEETFGGPLGNTPKGWEKAMKRCLSHFLEEQKQHLSIEKATAALDREIQAKKAPEITGPTA